VSLAASPIEAGAGDRGQAEGAARPHLPCREMSLPGAAHEFTRSEGSARCGLVTHAVTVLAVSEARRVST
jgi:hypothetical protein